MDAPSNPTPNSNSTDEAIAKVKMYASQAYEKTSQVSRETYNKIDQKYHDPQFQQDMQEFKDKVGEKSRQFGNTTIEYSNKAYFGIRSGVTSAWDIIRAKYNEINNKENIAQEPNLSLKEELLKKDEKEVD